MQTTPRQYQQLHPEDRVTMASLLQQNYSLRDIATVLNRSPSTISRRTWCACLGRRDVFRLDA
ncbi:helix-turn-helix domain-containing protein [Hydrogenophaga atypica]|uniref:Helix-turn-helix domain-containing protein n=1 Tax=Hydrogenophaga atypica TaxID=249409 RepID=A0ABW2QJX8_9BURK